MRSPTWRSVLVQLMKLKCTHLQNKVAYFSAINHHSQRSDAAVSPDNHPHTGTVTFSRFNRDSHLHAVQHNQSIYTHTPTQTIIQHIHTPIHPHINTLIHQTLIHEYTHTPTQTLIHQCTHTPTHSYTNTNTHTPINSHTNTLTHQHTHTPTHTHTSNTLINQTLIHEYTHTQTGTYTAMHSHTNTLIQHKHSYTNTHTNRDTHTPKRSNAIEITLNLSDPVHPIRDIAIYIAIHPD
jgi:hypothetical protein